MTADCQDCTQARQRRWWGGYRRDCRGCQTRALARSTMAFDAIRAGRSNELREAISRVFPHVPYHEVREQILDWWRVDHQQEAACPTSTTP